MHSLESASVINGLDRRVMEEDGLLMFEAVTGSLEENEKKMVTRIAQARAIMSTTYPIALGRRSH